jgi:hypothetical protein
MLCWLPCLLPSAWSGSDDGAALAAALELDRAGGVLALALARADDPTVATVRRCAVIKSDPPGRFPTGAAPPEALEEWLDDPELAALCVCIKTLAPLTAESRRRVLEYVAQRFPEGE